MGCATWKLLVRLDPESGVALQQQVYTAIRRAIFDGLIDGGTRLPSTRALAGDLGVSRTTTMVAYEQLLAEGYVGTRHGSGTFVAHDLPGDIPSRALPERSTCDTHPWLSRRGAALAAVPPPARRLAGPPRSFRIGVPAVDLFPLAEWSRLAARCARALSVTDLDYADPAGLPQLRQQIAQHVSLARGTRCTAEQVIVVAGAQRGIDLLCRLLLDPDDSAWVEDPGYAGARSALVAAGADIVPVPVDAHGLDVDAGTARAPDAHLACVTPSHQFPLGVQMSAPRRVALVDWARAAGAWIIEDDHDSEFRYGTQPVPALHALDGDGRVIYVGSFSKSLFPSLRLGFIVVPLALAPRVLSVRRASDMHPATLDQTIVAEFMARGQYERHLRRMRDVYGERLDAMGEALERYCGGALELRPVTTGLHAVADLHVSDADSVAGECCARGVEVTPLSSYFMSRTDRPNALVLGFAAVPPEEIRTGAQRLADAIEAARCDGRRRPS